jgi:acyl-coenzyme A thioesterase PaaI-like protein
VELQYFSLQSQLYIQEKFTLLPVRFTDKHTGYPGYVHGGIVSSALDEAMAWSAARYFRRMCVTAELTVRFLKRVPLNKELLVRAWIAKEHHLLANTESVLIDEESNKVLVKAWENLCQFQKREHNG